MSSLGSPEPEFYLSPGVPVTCLHFTQLQNKEGHDNNKKTIIYIYIYFLQNFRILKYIYIVSHFILQSG